MGLIGFGLGMIGAWAEGVGVAGLPVCEACLNLSLQKPEVQRCHKHATRDAPILLNDRLHEEHIKRES